MSGSGRPRTTSFADANRGSTSSYGGLKVSRK